MAILTFDVDQSSLAWMRMRSGIPTASMFHHILTPKLAQISKQRFGYACQLIAERLLKWQPENLDHIRHIEEGKASEPEAIKRLEFVVGIETTPIGFARTNDGRFGASPDRVMGVHESSVDTVIEAKAPTIPVQVQRLLFGNGEEYKSQVMGQLYVCEADKAIFYSYHQRTPAYLVETGRDEAFISKLVAALEQFSDELDEWTEKARRLGAWEAFAEIVSPTDATFGSDVKELAGIIEGTTPMRGWGG